MTIQNQNDVWTYGQHLSADQGMWVGYHVHAVDGDIGKVDEMTTDVGRSHIVVDTGPWIFGKKRLIPASAVRSVDHEEMCVNVSLTKDQIKDAPDCDTGRMRDDSWYDEQSRYYSPFI